MTMLVPQGSANFAHFAFSAIFFADSGLPGVQLFASMALTGEKQLQTAATHEAIYCQYSDLIFLLNLILKVITLTQPCHTICRTLNMICQ